MKVGIFKKGKIEDKSKIIRLLRKNLLRELRIIRHYEKNLGRFTTKKEKDSVKKLVDESIKHARMFVEAMHRLSAEEKAAPASPKQEKKKIAVLGRGMREELGAEQIYRYQAARIADKDTVGVLRSIAKNEKEHQRIVKRLASDASKKIPAKDARKIMKKYRL